MTTRDTDPRTVRLYCAACNEVHAFTRGGVERLVYVLLGEAEAMLSDEDMRSAVLDAKDSPYHNYADVECLDVLAGAAGDIEQWAEWVESLVDCRRGHDVIPAPESNDG